MKLEKKKSLPVSWAIPFIKIIGNLKKNFQIKKAGRIYIASTSLWLISK